MFNDVVLHLWESRPVINKIQDEASEIDQERVDIDPKSGLPVLETIHHGVSQHFYFE